MQTLQDWVKKHGQSATARQMGVTHGAVYQMLASGRQIAVEERGDLIFFKEFKTLAVCDRLLS